MDFEIDAIAILATAHPNVHLVGSDPAVERGLDVIAQFLRTPVLTWTPFERRPLPDAACGTLIVRSIDAADRAQQSQLLVWVNDRAGATQLVSTTRAELVPMIARGAFLETLYYRMNQVTFRVQDQFNTH